MCLAFGTGPQVERIRRSPTAQGTSSYPARPDFGPCEAYRRRLTTLAPLDRIAFFRQDRPSDRDKARGGQQPPRGVRVAPTTEGDLG